MINPALAMAVNHAIHLGSRRLWQHCIAGDACESPKILAATIGSLICEFGERRPLPEEDEIEDMDELAKVTAEAVARDAVLLTSVAACVLLTRTPKEVWRSVRLLEQQKRHVLETVLAHHEHCAQQKILGRKPS